MSPYFDILHIYKHCKAHKTSRTKANICSIQDEGQECTTQINKSYLRHSMLKKCVIFFFLSTAYSVLLAHNFTPHHHQINKETHHHGDGKEHQHPNNNEDHQEGNTANLFHLLQHTGESAVVFIPGQALQTGIQKKNFETVAIKLADLFINQIEKPPLILPSSRTQYFSLPQSLPYFFLLKAPPSFNT